MFISPLLFRKRALFAVGPPRDPPEVPQPTPGAPRGVRGGCVTDGDSDVAAATPVNAGAVTPRLTGELRPCLTDGDSDVAALGRGGRVTDGDSDVAAATPVNGGAVMRRLTGELRPCA